MLADRGASEHFLDDDLVPRMKNQMKDYTSLNVRETIVATGNRTLHGTATGTLHGTIVDQISKTRRVWFLSLIVSGLGHRVYSSSVTVQKRVTTILEEGKPHRRKNGAVVPLTRRRLGSDCIRSGD